MAPKPVMFACWIAGFVVGTSSAWWWGNVYLSFAVLLGGIVLTLVAWTPR